MFYPPDLRQHAERNAETYPWAAAIRAEIIQTAQPWLPLSDDTLWSLVFGPRITRSWMVWSNGHCPACLHSVPMYAWEIDGLTRPWQVRCPHCHESFPKNDFSAYYRSGLDVHGLFDPALANRALLVNCEHPDLADPLHTFGVDDGEGYVQGEHRWCFIGAYLIYGQWKQAIVDGIRRLAAAYTVSGDPLYAHKAGVLLDRVADVYPEFDFISQGTVYETGGQQGYVSTWHDAAAECQVLVLAYDQVREALARDNELAAFAARQAERYQPALPKHTPADVTANIEQRILHDILANPRKTTTNFPRGEILCILTAAVLGWPANRTQLEAEIDAMLEEATAVDGVTGEKGLSAYSSGVIQSLAEFLETWARIDPDLLPHLLARHPRLAQTYRFHIDTLCLGRFYPQVGDCGYFDNSGESYLGVRFQRAGEAATLFDPWPPVSMYSFLWRLYQLTGDEAYVQVLVGANGSRCDDLPRDLFASDPEAMQQQAAAIVARSGTEPQLASVNKREWHLAILRSGQGERARAAWLKYDAGMRHSHADALNLGLMAYGLDLLPDFGYPPVQYGGWRNPRADWYRITASHNTVVVDGNPGWEMNGAGETTLWLTGQTVQAVRASAPQVLKAPQFERTIALVDVSDDDFYLLDITRVVAGREHAKFSHSTFGQASPIGLRLQPTPDFGHEALLRGFQLDPKAQPGWSLDWSIWPHNQPNGDLHLRLTELTNTCEGGLCEAWVAPHGFEGNAEAWIPCAVSIRRAEQAPLCSTFISVWEPYIATRSLSTIRRLVLTNPSGEPLPEGDVALEITLTDGRRDVWLCRDVYNPLCAQPALAAQAEVRLPEYGITLSAELAWLRLDDRLRPQRLALANGRRANGPGWQLELPVATPGSEFVWQDAGWQACAGTDQTS